MACLFDLDLSVQPSGYLAISKCLALQLGHTS